MPGCKTEDGYRFEMEDAKNANGNYAREKHDADGDDEDDQVISNIGKWGKWQLKWFVILSFVTLQGGFHALSITFLSADTDFWCSGPDAASAVSAEGVTEWREQSSPLISKGGKMVRDQCNIWNTTDFTQPADNETRSCTEWTFNRTVFPNTVIQEFNLVCDRASWKDVGQMAFFFGLLIGVFATGLLSDKIGRKRTLAPVAILSGISGAITAAMPTVEAFIALRFLNGLLAIGVFTNAFVWCMEVVGGRWQTIIGIGCEISWVVAWFLLALAAYLLPNWRHLLLVTMIPSTVLGCLAFLIPESPKWLLVNGRLDEAEEIVRDGYKVNKGKELPSDWRLKPVTKVEDARANCCDLFKTRNMAIKTLIIYFNWFANSFVYYGLTLNTGNLGGSVMTTFLLNGLTEIPAYTFSLFILLKKGRKLPYASFMIMGGLLLFLTIAVPKETFPNDWPIVMLAVLGKMFITATFAIIYVYSAEIYPTVVRSIGVCSSSSFARVAGGVAPFVATAAKKIDPTFPVVIFGITAFVAGILALFLPETQHRKMPDTIEEGEAVPVSLKDGIFKRSSTTV